MLINSDSLLKKFESGALLFQPDIRRIIEEEPEAVIRCGKCKYYKRDIDMCVEPFSTVNNIVYEDDFCKRWKMKDGLD